MTDNNYDFVCENSVKECISTLDKYGICLVKDFLAPSVLQDLNQAFSNIIDDKINGSKRKFGHPTNKGGRQAVVDIPKATKEGAEVFKKISFCELISKVSEDFFAPNKCTIAANVLLTHLKPCPTPILPWHFDRLQTLKFWIYLKDTPKSAGAFEFCPGTHWEGRFRASYHMATGKSVHNLPNDVPQKRILNPVTIEANAGDLIIFDPDGFHRGGVVEEGFERKVLRIDTYPTKRRKSFDRIGSIGWFLQTPFNIAKLFKSQTFRVLGEHISDKSINREKNSITS